MDRNSQGHRRYNRYPTRFLPLLALTSLQPTRFSRRNQIRISSNRSTPEQKRHDPFSCSSVQTSSTSLSTSTTCMVRPVPTPISRPWSSARKLSRGQLPVRHSLSLCSILTSLSRQGACPQGSACLANARHRRHLVRLFETRSRRCRDPEADKDEQHLYPRMDRCKWCPPGKMRSLLYSLISFRNICLSVNMSAILATGV